MRREFSFSIILLLLLGIAFSSEARVDSLTGGLEVGLDIERRTEKINGGGTSTSITNQNNDFNKLVTTPSLRFRSEDIKDFIDFKYAPGFKYDLDGKGNDIDHRLDLSIQRSIVKEWQIKISDLYVKSDDVNQTVNTLSSSGDNNSVSISNNGNNQISNEFGRRRFWNNNASIFSNYSYFNDSLMTLGYSYSVLRNDDTTTPGGFQDFDRHDGSLSVSYRVNPEWKTIVGGQYTRGLFDTQQSSTSALTSDLNQYLGNVTLESYILAKNTLSVSYEYIGTRFDEPTQLDDDIHQGILGWKQEVSPRMKFDVGGGPSYVKSETQEAKWGYNAHANINYSIAEHGKLDFGVQKGFSHDNFSGTSNGGFIDSWQVKGGFAYELYKGFFYRLFASYKDNDHQNAVASPISTIASTQEPTQVTSYTAKIYQAGLNMNYTFWGYYTATAGYTFSRQDSNSSLANDYDDHRIYLTLGVQNELFRW